MNPAPRAYALVVAVALAASLPSLRNGFVYDDVAAVQSDARIRTLEHPARLLTLPYWNNDIRDRIYRPLTTASFALDWKAGGGSALPFHLVNLVLHLVVCALVYAMARRVLGAGPGALVAALWYSVHPVHVEVFATVVGRSELIAAAGYLAAVMAYAAEGDEVLRAAGGRRRALFAVVALGAAAVAYGGKEHALTLPAALLLADAWSAHVHAERFAVVFRRHALLWLAAAVMGFGFLAARAAVVGTALGGGAIGAGLENLSMPGRAIVMLPALLVWARLLVWPVRLSADYSPDAFIPATTLTVAHVAAILLVTGAFYGAWALRRRAPGALAGLAWFVVTASVAMNLVVPTGVLLAERVLYLPSAGAALIAGALWERIYVRAWPRWRSAWLLTSIALGLLAARTLTRIPVWRNAENFFAALIHDAPDSYRSYWAKGARAFDANDPRTGEQEYRHAMRIHPGDAAVVQELGEHYLTAGLAGPADHYLTLAYRLDTTRADAAVQAVAARLRLGRFDSAAALGVEALRRFPDATTLLIATAQAWEGLNQPLRALTYRRRVAFGNPGHWQSQYIAADGALRAGQCEEARYRLSRALALAPAEEPLLRFGEALDRPPCRPAS